MNELNMMTQYGVGHREVPGLWAKKRGTSPKKEGPTEQITRALCSLGRGLAPRILPPPVVSGLSLFSQLLLSVSPILYILLFSSAVPSSDWLSSFTAKASPTSSYISFPPFHSVLTSDIKNSPTPLYSNVPLGGEHTSDLLMDKSHGPHWPDAKLSRLWQPLTQ